MGTLTRARGGGFGGTERFPLALHRGFPAVQREDMGGGFEEVAAYSRAVPEPPR